MRHLPVVSIYGYVGGTDLGVMSVRVGVANFFWSIDRY